ncbi:MAG: hypothetical protein GW946_01165 [Candidatus Pacebacteria bacterium]|nr:hypothetical protein [Candidatus Paceibacterota bacterium]PIR60719.1 MAG: hypothetical protein COU67_01160 [Candidatus Pacebacteria bacterium CG10_big_fil_rev_8_21_14_0_10_44_54]
MSKLLRNKEEILLLLLIFLLALGQLQRLPFPWGAQYAHELALLLYLFTCRQRYAKILFTSWKNLTTNSKILTILTVSGVLLHELTTTDQRALLLSVRAFLYGSAAWVVYQSATDKLKLRLRFFLLASGVGMAIIGSLQYLFLPDTRFLQILGWDDHYYRAIGSMLDPNYLGIILLLTLANLWTWTKKLRPEIILAGTLVLSMTIAATFSRASFLATAVFLASQAVSKRLLVVLTTLVLILTIVVLPKPTGEGVNLLRSSTITSRIDNDKAIIQTQKQPMKVLFGTGLFSSTRQTTLENKSMDHGLQANNIFIFLYQSIGVVGMLLLAPALVKGIRSIYKKEPIIAYALAAIFIHAQFNNTFFEPIVFSYWVLTSASLSRQQNDQHV